MRRRQGDPLMTTVLALIATAVPPRMPMSKLAGKVKTRTGYPGAYRTIGRLQAAGYVDILEVDVTRVSRSAAEVRLTRSGLLRYSIGTVQGGLSAATVAGAVQGVTYNRTTGHLTVERDTPETP